MKVDFVNKVKQLVTLMNENDLAEIEIQEKATKIRIRKADTAVVVEASSGKTVAAEMDSAKLLDAKEPDPIDHVEITAPMVGTFYRSSSPGAEPFVSVGDNVDMDTVVCIVEAMKIMNEVKSGVEGKIVEVLVKDSEPVEYGKPMFRVK